MPTKSNNIGGRGGARPGAGRKKKPVKEKAENGNPGGRKLTVLDFPEQQGMEMPKPSDFLSADQEVKSYPKLQAADIYKRTWEWLNEVGCSALISPQLLERYSMAAARWIQCEEILSKYGMLGKHPTTGAAIPSPYVNIGIQYMNQANRLWDDIFQIIKENCSTNYESGSNPQNDVMERLLRARGS